MRAGSVLFFYQDIVHEGEPVGPVGHKFIIRTDVMFARDDPLCTAPADIEAFKLMKAAEELENSGEAAEAAQYFRRAFKLSPALAEIYGC